jgi:DNA end-binding protein Ku
MSMLRYAEELRKPEDFFDEVPPEKPSKEMVDLAVQLISQKTAPFKPESFEDHYQTALQDLVKAKLKGRKIIIATPETPRALGGNVVDLMAQLRASVEGKAKGKAAGKPKSPRSKKSA